MGTTAELISAGSCNNARPRFMYRPILSLAQSNYASSLIVSVPGGTQFHSVYDLMVPVAVPFLRHPRGLGPLIVTLTLQDSNQTARYYL